MLSSEHVRAYRRGSKLMIAAMKPADRERARTLAQQYLAITKAHVGQTRGALDDALAGVGFSARDRKVAGGLRKLILERCEFDAVTEHDPVALRRTIFERAGAVRRAAQAGQDFDRSRVLAEAAIEMGVDVKDIERLMYTDLKSAHHVLSFTGVQPDALVELYQEGQAQAVLLRARRVTARVYSATPADYRALFHKLKFLRLLFTIAPLPDGGYELTIDGPYSLFRSVLKYGVSLANMLPALRVCERWSLDAEVEWGKKKRELLQFHLESPQAGHDDPHKESDGPRPPEQTPAPRLPDEVSTLLSRFQSRLAEGKTQWEATLAQDILSLPGVGVCVPDLMFVHQETGECVYLEVMGFWSRDAVWKRVELVEQGLPTHIVFAVPSRLRVSETALDPDLPGALYVYKGVISPRAVEQRLDGLVRVPD